MAKSQYTDFITGDVIHNLRIVDGKITNVYPACTCSRYSNSNNLVSVSLTEKPSFSIGSIVFNPQKINGNFLEKIAFNTTETMTSLTISVWASVRNVKTYASNTGWDHGSIWLQNSNDPNGECIQIKFCSDEQAILNGKRGISIARNNEPITSIVANSVATQNQWDHYAITYQNSTYKYYINGSLIGSCSHNDNIFTTYGAGALLYCCGRSHSFAIDDFVVIKNQILWDANFNVPNYYLTGDPNIPKRFSKKHILYPIPTDRNDYFDKAYLY